MRKNEARFIAIGGVFAALAIVIMCLGGLVPIATYVCPVLSTLTGSVVLRLCGKRVAWAWYGAVSLLSLLLAPDKEAAAVFVIIGCYPIFKPRFESSRFSVLWKLLYFNASVFVLYSALLYLLGMEQLLAEFTEFGTFGLVVLLLLGNLTFWLMDRLLSRIKH